MFQPAPASFPNFIDSWRRPAGAYTLRDVQLAVRDSSRANFSAIVDAPDGSSPWVRCWVSNAVEGTLAECERSDVAPGENVQLDVELNSESIPELACIRIESKQFATEHTLHVRLCNGETYFLDELRLELDSVESIREMLASLDEATRAELSQDWLDMISSAKEPVAWIHGFSVHDRKTGDRVGSGGFKGPPANGEVEIAYGIDEPFRGKGFATTVATALTYYAFGQSSDVKKVIAHTLPEKNASTSVLSKCGFTNVGEFTDPEDGQVWRWEKAAKDC
jgi:RimJ/RimL family protein N-acetyltransferase